MMNYEMFKEMVSQKITDYMPEEYRDRKIALSSVDKINQKRDALTFMVEEEEICIWIPCMRNIFTMRILNQ